MTGMKDKKAIHAAMLDLIRVFISECNRLSVPYFAISGTLLGMVRHKAFIPWDDDLDFAMLRPDYEVFRKNARFEGRYIMRPHKNPDHPSFMQILDTSTRRAHKASRHFGSIGIDLCSENDAWFNLDVFPLHFVPEDKDERDRYIDLCWSKLQSLSQDEFAKFVMSHPKTGKMATPTWWTKTYKKPFDTDMFSDPATLPELDLCGVMVRIPRNTEQCLVCNYGENWRTPNMNAAFHQACEYVDAGPNYRRSYARTAEDARLFRN